MPEIATVDKLRHVVEHLAPHEQNFANSLIEQFDRRQSLSNKQWPYVQKLYDRAIALHDRAVAAKQPELFQTKQDRPVTKIGSMGPIVELFDNAKSSGLKFPKIRFGHEDHSIVLSVAGPNARMPGTINVVCDEVWLGRVTRDGDFHQSPRDEAPIDVKSVLEKLAANPLEEMELYGKRTGNCCLCGKTLTNSVSIERGIGPICAGKWNL